MPDYGYDKYGRRILGYKKNRYGGTFPIVDPSDMVDNDYDKDPEFQKASEAVSEGVTKKDELTRQWLDLVKQRDEEVIVMDGLDKDLSRALGSYTEKGKELANQAKQLKEEIDALDANLKADRSYIKSTHSRYHNKEMADWEQNQPPMKPQSRHEYEGFELDTHVPVYNEALKNGDAYIVEMSPKEYMQRVSYDIFSKIPENEHNTTMRTTMNGVNFETASRYASEMAAGDKFPLPYLDYDGLVYSTPGQEGRHRAVAAYINGYDKIPVLIYKKRRR